MTDATLIRARMCVIEALLDALEHDAQFSWVLRNCHGAWHFEAVSDSRTKS